MQLREARSQRGDYVVAHIKAVGLNVQDFVPEYQTATYWARQYEVLRINRAKYPDLYHGQKERPHSSLVRSKLKPPMVDVRDTALNYLSNNAYQFGYTINN